MLMMRPQSAPRATCRRVNSAIIKATARVLTANKRSKMPASIVEGDLGPLRGEGFGRCGADPVGIVGAGDQDHLLS